MNSVIAEQLQTVADNLATEHQEIATQAELLQQIKAGLSGKAGPGLGAKLYQHQILFGAVNDSFYIGDIEASPVMSLMVYNRNPNEMTMQDIINGGYLNYLPVTNSWLANWGTGLDTTAFVTGAYAHDNNIVIDMYYVNDDGSGMGYQEIRYPISACEVEDTVTEV